MQRGACCAWRLSSAYGKTGDGMPRHKWSIANSRADAALTWGFTALMIFAVVVGIATATHLPG